MTVGQVYKAREQMGDAYDYVKVTGIFTLGHDKPDEACLTPLSAFDQVVQVSTDHLYRNYDALTEDEAAQKPWLPSDYVDPGPYKVPPLDRSWREGARGRFEPNRANPLGDG
jgi:hypothetical protein